MIVMIYNPGVYKEYLLPNIMDADVYKRQEVYTVMEYIDGYDLQYYQKQGYQFSEEQFILWLRQLCEVLEYLHGQNPAILHSDIKPANIMITPEGNVCLIDFNISLEEDGSEELQGLSPWFAAPEQFEKAALLPVSYTHLDVYKRQVISMSV